MSINSNVNVIGLSSLIISDDTPASKQFDWKSFEDEIVKGVTAKPVKMEDPEEHLKHQLSKINNIAETPTGMFQSGKITFEPIPTTEKRDETNIDAFLNKQEPSMFPEYSSVPSAPPPQPSYERPMPNQEEINSSVMQNMYRGQDTSINKLKLDTIEDDKILMLDHIESLIDDIESSGGSIKNIVRPTKNDSADKVKDVFMVLKRRVNRTHYTHAAKEMMLMLAKGAELLFNGERDWFGFKIDLTGWSTTVNTKLNTMQYETSNFVGSVFSDGKLSYPMLLLIEFVPSAVLHSINRAATKKEREKRNWKAPTPEDLKAAQTALENVRDRTHRK